MLIERTIVKDLLNKKGNVSFEQLRQKLNDRAAASEEKEKRGSWSRFTTIVVLFIILEIFIIGCNEVKVNDVCETDEDCKNLDCPQYQNQIPRGYGICEYNKCVCGCGDPENGVLCE